MNDYQPYTLESGKICLNGNTVFIYDPKDLVSIRSDVLVEVLNKAYQSGFIDATNEADRFYEQAKIAEFKQKHGASVVA